MAEDLISRGIGTWCAMLIKVVFYDLSRTISVT